ncbi:cytochrome P450 [Paenibacillus mucilaginosus]|uniref:Cytochrome P450 hydroxylase n=1 Tax=Paenibacillus mucilaginosus (strain KNP414) TaxID=1036673 RepID=F8FBZ3_PAEMK|nr:cytochrome P450 [Paenibacillus mucilaginosus]AEI43754.1 cytochrome P450 hydroxylase [Paenibacillus mucilaginosus KNP414]MCG7212721.1 cytochrome P450 [Paenibacillus mucilaginosus]WDM25263.1 cytochrome P450 [Paenibacillus mucilaginosus]
MTKTQAGVPGPRPVPLLGNLLSMGAEPHVFFAKCAEQYGPVVRIKIDPRRDTFLITRPQDIQHVLNQTQRYFAKGYHRDPILSRVLGNGLVTSEGSFWLRQRRLSQPAFHHHRIRSYADIMTAYAQRMLAAWEHEESRDIHADMMQCTMEIVAKTLFDVDLHAEDGRSNPVGEALDAVFHEYVKQYTSVMRRLLDLLPVSVPVPGDKKLQESVEQLNRIILDIIDRRQAEGTEDRGDLLSMLLLARDEDGTGMTREQLRDEIMTLFLAGHETTANVLSWTLYLLAREPEAEGKLLKELDRVLGGQPPAFEHIPLLTYTQSVVKESMRLYPPVWLISREPIEDVEIGGYTLPAGCEISVCQWVMHRLPEYFEEPERFQPERWTPEFEKSLPAGVYIPFGAGPRVCIGNQFAMMEAVLLLASIGQRFRLTLEPGHKVLLEPSITLRPQTGIRVRVWKRSAEQEKAD